MGGAGRVWISIVVVVVMAVLVCGLGDSASPSQHAAPAPSVDCISLISTMADCLPFVSNGSTATKPAETCCNGLKTVLEADASCLCVAFKSSAQLGIVLNVTKATSLPAACQVSAPSVADCGLSVTPSGAPGGGAGAPESSAGGNEQTTAPGSSGSFMLASSVGSLLVGLVIASFPCF